jgi:hypothetical protein
MRTCALRAVAIALVLVSLAGTSGLSQSFLRSIGIRVVLPWTGLPLLIGVEGAADVSFGRCAASLFLTSRGQALLTLSADVLLSAPTNPISTSVRLTTGIAYLEPSAYAPTPLVGAGVFYEIDVLDPLLPGVAVEFLYPLAFPLPMVSTCVGWSIR